ncbi:MAG: hypothetical protein WCO09_01085 [bacterium]
MKKTIVILSNPFGYGPTGKAIAIAKEFIRSGYTNIVFAGNSFTREIVPSSIGSIGVDERSEESIKDLLKTIQNPVVISSQNRFAIKAAISLKIPCAFLDGLSWFWKEIPADHFIADEIFWMNYPGIEEKITKSPHLINIVPTIVDVESTNPIRDQILIHLGGCKNPLVDVFPKNYLDILTTSLLKVSDQWKIKVTGGAEAMDYLNSIFLLDKKNKVDALSLNHDEFVRELDRSQHFVTTAGQTATLEAFALGIPTSFLLPMNLSQLALTDLLSQHNACPQHLRWDCYSTTKTNIPLTEKDAIVSFNGLVDTIKEGKEICKKLEDDIARLIETVPDIDGQRLFIEKIGIGGAAVIREILTQKWGLEV